MTPRPLLLAGICLAALAGGPALAPAQNRPPAGATQGSPPAPGLDELDESRVLTELAGRGLTDLLKHAFERQGVPENQRTWLLARISLNRLQTGEALSPAERRELVQDVVASADQTISEAKDPNLLFEQAQMLLDKGVNEEVRLLEYFGDNPHLRLHLRPVADAVSRMLERSAELYQAEADELANRINNPGDPIIKQWREADQAAKRARDYRVFAEYNRILALDPDAPQRLRLADDLMEAVKPADNEGNPRRTFVQTYLGKVALARGNERGIALAREHFEQVIASAQDEREMFDAFFFRTATEIEDRKIDDARSQFERFAAWFQTRNMPDHAPLMLVLEYRLEDSASRHAPGEPARQAAQARATQILVSLVDQYEGYRSVVTDQLLTRVNQNTDFSTLSPLLLDAIADRGRAEAARLAEQQAAQRTVDAAQQADRGAIERGIAAARELVRRGAAGDAQVDAALVSRNAFLMGLMLDLLDHRLEAAEAFIAYDKVPGAQREQRIAAFRRALGIVEELKRDPALPEPQRLRVDALEGELLPLLVDEPVNDKNRAFDLANRLHRLGRLDDAARYYAQVPETDPRRADATYLMLLARAARLGELEATSPVRAAIGQEIPRLGERALAELEAAAARATDEPARQAYRERLARAKVILARVALADQDDPRLALSLVERIEQDVEGLPGAESVLASALPLRFQATAATGDIERATRDLLALLERSDAERGLAYIAQFRETLNRAVLAAEARADDEALEQVIDTRAGVTPRLVEWIERSTDPEYRRYVYNFRRFDAETQLQAAQLADEPGERRSRLRRAFEAYTALETPESLERYRSLLEEMTPEQRQQVPYDREVVLALGNIAFEMEDFEEARARYGRLLADRAMGNAVRIVEQDGMTRQESNEAFWEVHYKFLRSSLASGSSREAMSQQLRDLYAAYGEQTGGRGWRDEFEALRQELIGPSTAPATRPPAA